jgi:alpha 1,6-mannosyltransferase
MLTFRKALVIAAFVLACIYLLQQSTYSTRTHYTQGQDDDVKPGKLAVAHQTGTSAGSVSHSSAPIAPEPGASTGKHASQQTFNPTGKSLQDRLRYQFPYERDGRFPAYIWQTWKATPAEGDFGDDLRPSEASWTELHPTFVHEVITDKVAVNLIRYLYASVPEVQEAYDSLPATVLKADLFRYLILLARGGIYSDIDTVALKPATDWIPPEVPPSSIGLIVGIEVDADRPDWKIWYSRQIQFCQWTIQAKAGHPVLREIVAAITEDTLRMKRQGILTMKKLDKSVMEFTGPARWTDIIFNYLNSPDYFKIDRNGKNITYESFVGTTTAKKVGDVVVLPITSFSPGVNTMNAKDVDDPMAFVKHDFAGQSISPLPRFPSIRLPYAQVHGNPPASRSSPSTRTASSSSNPAHTTTKQPSPFGPTAAHHTAYHPHPNHPNFSHAYGPTIFFRKCVI